MRSSIPRIAATAVPAAAGGAALAFFLDPDRGRTRRADVAQRLGGARRSAMRRGERAGRHAASDAAGMAQRAAHPQWTQAPPPNDITLARKVETEIFRGDDVPKGSIVVNAQEGVVHLRGKADSEDRIEELESQARAIPGVRDVRLALSVGAPGEDGGR